MKRSDRKIGLATNDEARLLFNYLDNLLDMTIAQRENYLLTIELTMKLSTSPPNVNVQVPVNSGSK